jgi:hypothetical protein
MERDEKGRFNQNRIHFMLGMGHSLGRQRRSDRNTHNIQKWKSLLPVGAGFDEHLVLSCRLWHQTTSPIFTLACHHFKHCHFCIASDGSLSHLSCRSCGLRNNCYSGRNELEGLRAIESEDIHHEALPGMQQRNL